MSDTHSYSHSPAWVFVDEDYTKINSNTYTWPELLLETMTHMHTLIEAIKKLLNDLLPIGTKRYNSWDVERTYLVSVLFSSTV